MTAVARDRGSASIWLLAVGLVLLAAVLLATTLGAALVARHEAQRAADLAALAGAVHVIGGEQVACQRAGQLAAANGAQMVHCYLAGVDLAVTVQMAGPPAARLPRPATATARAGPIRADDSR